MYKSPISLIVEDIMVDFDKKLENEVMVRLRRDYGIEVDKDRLLAALRNDRQSYDDGYRDGWKAAQREFYRLSCDDGYSERLMASALKEKFPDLSRSFLKEDK